MPTVPAVDGLAVRIYLPPRGHQPPHVHVFRGGAPVIIRLGGAAEPPSVYEVRGMRDADVVCAYRPVNAHRAALLDAWNRYHD